MSRKHCFTLDNHAKGVLTKVVTWSRQKVFIIITIIIFNNIYVCIRVHTYIYIYIYVRICIYIYILTVGFVGLWSLWLIFPGETSGVLLLQASVFPIFIKLEMESKKRNYILNFTSNLQIPQPKIRGSRPCCWLPRSHGCFGFGVWGSEIRRSQISSQEVPPWSHLRMSWLVGEIGIVWHEYISARLAFSGQKWNRFSSEPERIATVLHQRCSARPPDPPWLSSVWISCAFEGYLPP